MSVPERIHAVQWRVLLMILMVLVAGRTFAVEIEKVQFVDAYQVDDVKLQLNNVGLMRYKGFFKAMVAGLYVQENTPRSGVLTDVPKRLEIEYFWALKAKDIVKASQKLLADNVDGRTLQRIQLQVVRMHSLYADIRPGDRYALTYLPGRGTFLSLNGEYKGVVPGADFAAAYFSIWLGDQPMDMTLKHQLLSGRR